MQNGLTITNYIVVVLAFVSKSILLHSGDNRPIYSSGEDDSDVETSKARRLEKSKKLDSDSEGEKRRSRSRSRSVVHLLCTYEYGL